MTTHRHTVVWEQPAPEPDAAQLTGLESMQRSIDRGERRSAISALMDFRLLRVAPGLAVLEGVPGPQHQNAMGIAHGGFAATLLDAACWSAVNTTMTPGFTHLTLELKVSYARPVVTGAGPVTCEGKVLSRGRRMALAEARLLGAGDRLLAHATSTLMIMPRED